MDTLGRDIGYSGDEVAGAFAPKRSGLPSAAKKSRARKRKGMRAHSINHPRFMASADVPAAAAMSRIEVAFEQCATERDFADDGAARLKGQALYERW